jgi:hypothetical protein
LYLLLDSPCRWMHLKDIRIASQNFLLLVEVIC